MKKKILNISLVILLSFLASLAFEIIIVNHEVLTKKSDKEPLILEKKDIKEKDGYFITTSDESYIVFKTKEKYINKIKFDYKCNNTFNWLLSYDNINGKEKKILQSSSNITNKSIKKVDKNINKVKLSFFNKNIKIKNVEMDNSIFIYWSRVISLTIILSIIGVLFLYRKSLKSIKIQNLFLILSLLLGFAFVMITPKTLNTSFDDQIHFAHSLNPFKKSVMKFSHSEELTAQGYFLNNSSLFETKEEKIEYYRAMNRIHRETKGRISQVSNERSLYGNIVYLPFYIGYKTANLLNMSFTTCFIMGKIFNLLFYSLLFYLAIKYAKYGKKVIFLIGMIPQCLFYATQYSYDSTIIAGMTLASVCFINLISEERIDKKYIIIFILSVIWASLPKALYCPFLLLLLFIPNKKFDNKKQAILFKILIIILTILVLSTFVLPTATGEMTADDRGDNASVSGQISYILGHPFDYIKTLVLFTVKTGWKNTFGPKNFGYLPYIVSLNYFSFMYYIYLATFLYYSFTSKATKELNIKYRILLILEIVCIWILFCTALYIKFTKVGSNSISGIQPRYMLPLYASMFYLFMSKKSKKDNNYYLYIIVPVLYISLIILYLSIKVA